MSRDDRNLLCVGGPAAGRRVDATGERFVMIPEVTQGPTGDPLPVEGPTVKANVYVRQAFHGDDEVFFCLVPEGRTGADTLRDLMAHYAPPCPPAK